MKMAAAHLCGFWAGILIFLTFLTSVSSEKVNVQSGSDITSCSMLCHSKKEVLFLYKVCGHETLLVEFWCNDHSHSNYSDPRLDVNTTSGCWSQGDARKNDSCNYITVYHNGNRPNTTLSVTVLDPVLITTITSNSSRLGQDIAVRVNFSGEETAVTWELDGRPLPDRYRLIDDNRTLIIPSAQREDAGRRLSVRITNPISNETRDYYLEITDPESFWIIVRPVLVGPVLVWAVLGGIAVIILIVVLVKKRKRKPKAVERNGVNDHSEEHGRLSSSSPESGRPGAEEERMGQNRVINAIRRIWRTWRNPEYKETSQVEMEEPRPQMTPP